jgi:hypothetical protein
MRGATATAGLSLLVAAPGPAGAGDVAAGAADSSAADSSAADSSAADNDGAGNLRYAEWAWHRPAGGGRADEDGSPGADRRASQN